tara:strand:- start:241 stop:633 length:393 start_codon:yes stop_codon:yes gene_type:complete
MAVRQTGRKQYRTMQGKNVDMDLLRQRNELTPAVGNVRVNARGDELGPGGKIVRKREEVLRDYYEDNVPATEFETPVQSAKVEADEAPAVQVEEQKKSSSVKAKSGKTKAETAEEDWVEDKDGNFVKRGA